MKGHSCDTAKKRKEKEIHEIYTTVLFYSHLCLLCFINLTTKMNTRAAQAKTISISQNCLLSFLVHTLSLNVSI